MRGGRKKLRWILIRASRIPKADRLTRPRGTRCWRIRMAFVGEYRRSYCSVAAVPIAQTEAGAMQRDYWYSVARTLSKLDAPEKVGRIAAERTLRRLGARKAKTAQVPIIFDPMVSTSILEHIFEGDERRFGLSRRVISRGQAGAEDCRRQRQHHRRWDDPRRFRDESV